MTPAREPLPERLFLYGLAAWATVSLLFAVTPMHQLLGAPMWLAYAVGLSSIAIFVYFFRRVERDERASVAAVTAGRPSLTAQEFAVRYFSAEAIPVATRCHELFAAIYRFDSSRIHPDDKLCADLHFAADDFLDAAELVLAIQREFHVAFTQSEEREMLTMRDIVTTILRKRSHKPNC